MPPPPIPRTLNFITGNANKLAEVRAILSPGLAARGITLTSQEVPGLVEIQASSMEEVSRDKCRRAAGAVSFSFFVFLFCFFGFA